MSFTAAEAAVLINAAVECARSQGVAVSVAVVDLSGGLHGSLRMDGAPSLSIRIAEAKACGSACWLMDGDRLEAVYRDRPGSFAMASGMLRLPLVPAAGSLVVRRSGGPNLGAVGVSGATAVQDLACAQAAVDALNSAADVLEPRLRA